MVHHHRRALTAVTTIIVVAAFGLAACGDGDYVGAGEATTTTVPSPLALLADHDGPTETEGINWVSDEQDEFYLDQLEMPDTDYSGIGMLPDGTIKVYLVHGAPVPPALAQRADARIARVTHSGAELTAVGAEVEAALENELGNPPNYTWNVNDGYPPEDNVVWVQFGPDMTWEEEARAAAVLKPFVDRGVVKVDRERGDIYGTDLRG